MKQQQRQWRPSVGLLVVVVSAACIPTTTQGFVVASSRSSASTVFHTSTTTTFDDHNNNNNNKRNIWSINDSRQPPGSRVLPSPLLLKSAVGYSDTSDPIDTTSTTTPPRGGAAATDVSDASSPPRRAVDWHAVTKYSIGFGTQVSLAFGLFRLMDVAVSRLMLPQTGLSQIPFAANVIFFYLFHLTVGKLFNPLSQKNRRKTNNSFIKPRWTPPGWVFGVMWPLFVFGLRAVTAAMMVQAAGGRYATTALLSLQAHLAFGNLWNIINRVDGRLGASVPALFGLLFSNIFASYQFYLVRPLAGKLLFATSLWLAAAAALETDTWRLNPENSTTGQRAPLYPAKDDSTNGEKWKTTKFRWET